MAAETGSPPAADREEQASRIPRGVVAIAALSALIVVIGGILYYGYMTRPGWVGVSGKKFWDYLDLLIVPTAIAIGVAVINSMQSRRERQAEEAQRVREQQMEDLQRERELEVERQRAMDTALETYIDKMETMIRDFDLFGLPTDILHSRGFVQVIRARTLTLLERLDGSRKRAVMRFLSETRMIQNPPSASQPVLLDLHDANLSDADLTRMNLANQNLSGARLTNAKLANTNLCGSELRAANLSAAILTEALLGMTGVKLSVPGEVDAEQAQDKPANLGEADLSFANLEGAAGWTVEQLSSAKSLEGTTMPDGQTLRGDRTPNGPTFEDWLKSKDRNEGQENDGSS